LEVTVSGIYEVRDPGDQYWMDDELDATGISDSTSLTILGPLVVDPTVFYTRIAPATSAMRWSAFPDFETVGVEDMSPMVARLDRLEENLNSGREVGNQMHVETGLGTILRATGRSLLVTRSAVLILTVQMVVLALYALLLAANLLADSREIETNTLRARGSSSSQLLAMSVMEGVILTVPALLVGPYLAAWMLRTLNGVGPLTAISLEIDPRPNSMAWLLGGVAGLGCILALTVPAYRSARRFGSVRADRARQTTAGLAGRAGVDIALLAVAGLGLWQLARYGVPLTRTIRGSLAIDPLLVAAPALALLAGAVLTLRALPLMARLGERGVTRSRNLVPALGVWHLGRQSKRFSRSALMLSLALAVGVFALAFDATWQKSQNDQAGFATGADIRAIPSTLAHALPTFALDDAYAHLETIEASTPVLEASGEVVGASHPIEYRALDSRTATEVVVFRDDQAVDPIGELIGDLDSARPAPWGIELPGKPAAIAVDVTMTLDPLEAELAETPDPRFSDFKPGLRAVLFDANDLPVRVDLGEIPQTGEPTRLAADLGYTDAAGDRFAPSYPLRLIGFETRAETPFHPYQRSAALTISGVEVGGDGSDWQEVTWQADRVTPSISPLRLAVEPPEMTLQMNSETTARILSGTTTADTRQAVYHMIWLDERPSVEAIPVLISSALADNVNVGVGDIIPLAGLPLYDGPATIVGLVDTFPTVDPNTRYAAVIDYPTYLAAVFDAGLFPPDPTSYLFEVVESESADIANALREEPFSSISATTRDEVLEGLVLDPASLGTIGSLLVGVVAALGLAAIGFVVNVVITNRTRETQFALMRAMGLPNSQLLRWVSIESGVVVLFALATGVGLGIVLAEIVLPLTTVTQQVTRVVPPIQVIYPWTRIAILVVAVIVILVTALFMTRVMLRRLEPATLLRAGDE
ncbi:MAG TPA: ABC transporter permease, partial [Acidimicrobiia bacterium]|nr:ABC transporter permease [Acidimicrobiia bacterium]